MRDTTVPVNRPLPDANRRVRYRVHLNTNDPAQVFSQGDTQQVISLDPRTAEVLVRSIRPSLHSGASKGEAASEAALNVQTEMGAWQTAKAGAPSDDDRQPNSLIQSDNPKIVSMARAIAADENDAWRVAVALESAVNAHIRRPDYSQAFASAADVVEQGEGDCTEHAVLLAALCRARGIPARIAIGLAYVSPAQGFGYHMWNEAWIGGTWIPLDATRAAGGIGAGYLKLSDSNLKGTTAFATFLSVAQVIGQLNIEILEVE
jgi:transglutaminase-like putative cysteine protease